MVGLALLRRIEERAATGSIGGVRIALHPELADAVQNGRRRELGELEREFGIRVEIIASPRLHRPQEEVEWLPRDATAPAPQPRALPAPVSAAELATGGPPAAQDEREKEERRVERREIKGRERRQARGGRGRGEPREGREREAAAEPAHEKRGRKRRRGRRKKEEGGTAEAAGPETGAAEAAVEPGEVRDEVEAQPDGEGGGRVKRRRRGRRGGRKRKGNGMAESPTAGTAASPAPERSLD
jgi:ribonuclease E